MDFTCMCGDTMPFGDLLNHVRLMHPDVYEPDLMDGPIEVHVTVPATGVAANEEFIKHLVNSISRARGRYI